MGSNIKNNNLCYKYLNPTDSSYKRTEIVKLLDNQ
jgi:hypothetical protein